MIAYFGDVINSTGKEISILEYVLRTFSVT